MGMILNNILVNALPRIARHSTRGCREQQGVGAQANPFQLPVEYQNALERKVQSVASLRRKVKAQPTMML